MTSFGDISPNDDPGPSRREVVKYGAAAAISAGFVLGGRVLAAANDAPFRVLFTRTVQAPPAVRRAIGASPAC
jgi:hypothetical protein